MTQFLLVAIQSKMIILDLRSIVLHQQFNMIDLIMIKAERAKLVSKILNEYYPETPVPLEHSSVYTLLIAVLLSAQCTCEKVLVLLDLAKISLIGIMM